jgi:DNA-binding winged helix-turn-helix (wHTH) protein/tetratricopeptide (TPR) repeat protein
MEEAHQFRRMKAFPPFRLDASNHCLWRGEELVSLAPKAFDVLRYLVENAGRLVTQEEILEALWPETYVNPEVVKKYVLGIRKVLGDQIDKPAFIATFPRRGYRFIAPISDESTPHVRDSSMSRAETIVGREGALEQLKQALGEALHGQKQIAFITGEAGIGKTTLVDVFHQGAAFGGNVRIARGQCVEGFGGKEAYYPILEALGHLLREAGADSIMQSLARRAPTWLVQFPSLVRPEQRDALEKEIIGATRERMVREICEALESITAQDPLILILEDLHWVDPSTLDFISALARRRGPAKLLLIGTYRPAEVILSHSPLKALKQDLVLHNLCHEIALERLEESDVAEYLAIKFDSGDFPAGFARLLYRHSGGNALFMVTILQDMIKKKQIAMNSGRFTLQIALESVDLSVPETLDQLIELQFGQLNSVEQRILKSASVAGERFSVWAIATAAEVDPDIIEDACESLAGRLQFIKASGTHESIGGQISAYYDFRHSLYREVVYRRLPKGTRSKLHLLLARRLKDFCNPCEQELAAELALHFEGGYEFAEAIKYLIIAANNTARRFAYRDSIEILHHALELATKLSPALRSESEVQILELIGNAHFVLGALPESANAYGSAASRAEEADLKTARVHALICAMYPLGFIDPGRGLAALDLAVQTSAIVDDPLLMARTQMGAAGSRLVFDMWNPEDADLCASAHETIMRLGAWGEDHFQQIVYAHVLSLQGNYREALEICETGGMSRMNHGISQIAHFGALSAKTLALLRMGRLGDVLRITQAGKEKVEENRARSWALDLREAWLRTIAFDFDGAMRICSTICENNPEFLAGQPETLGGFAAGCAWLDRGNHSQAMAHFNLVCNLESPTKFFLHWVWRMSAHFELANVWLLSGDIPKARVKADEFFKSAQSTADPHLQALAWELKARVAMAEDDMKSAREYIEGSIAMVEQFEILVAAWQAHATAWQFFQRAEEYETAEAHRVRAVSCILRISESFAPDEPLRATFLAATPVHRILQERVMNKPPHPRK